MCGSMHNHTLAMQRWLMLYSIQDRDRRPELHPSKGGTRKTQDEEESGIGSPIKSSGCFAQLMTARWKRYYDRLKFANAEEDGANERGQLDCPRSYYLKFECDVALQIHLTKFILMNGRRSYLMGTNQNLRS